MKRSAKPEFISLGSHADRGNFGRQTVDVGPDTGIAVQAIDSTQSALRVEVTHGRNDGVFQSGDVKFAGRRIIIDCDNGPRDDLTGRVIRDIPAAVGVDNDRIERLRWDQEVFFLSPDASRVGRWVFEHQDVVVTRLEQRALEVIGLGEGDPPEVASAQHLALALDVESRQQLTDSFEIGRRGDRFTDPVVKGEAQDESPSDAESDGVTFSDHDRHLAHGSHREHGDLGLNDDRFGP